MFGKLGSTLIPETFGSFWLAFITSEGDLKLSPEFTRLSNKFACASIFMGELTPELKPGEDVRESECNCFKSCDGFVVFSSSDEMSSIWISGMSCTGESSSASVSSSELMGTVSIDDDNFCLFLLGLLSIDPFGRMLRLKMVS